jgi:hypothetical protein
MSENIKSDSLPAQETLSSHDELVAHLLGAGSLHESLDVQDLGGSVSTNNEVRDLSATHVETGQSQSKSRERNLTGTGSPSGITPNRYW